MPPFSDKSQNDLAIHSLTCERGGRELFSPIERTVRAGEALFVTGANGSGKTTLLRALAGIGEVARGSVTFGGEAVELRSASWRRYCVYAGHRGGHKDDLSAMENLELACGLAGVVADGAALVKTLERVGLGQRRQLLVKRLSQGQKQRLMLARVSLCERKLWLLDEPSAALDADARGLLSEIIGDHLAQGGLAVIATHDRIDVGEGAGSELRIT
jgi:heme exporter protein A